MWTNLSSLTSNNNLNSVLLFLSPPLSSVDPTDQKKTACYDIDVEVDDPLKGQMNSFLSSTTNQQEIAALEMKVIDQIREYGIGGGGFSLCLELIICFSTGCIHCRYTRLLSTSTSWRLRETSCWVSAIIPRILSKTGSSLRAEIWR